MNLSQLEYILAVNKTKNFIHASKLCGISQPTLSMQIRKLEDHLGFAIFDRSKNPIIVTPEGSQFIDQAIVVNHEFKKLFEINKNYIPQGVFKVGIIPTISPYLVPLFFKEFNLAYPKIELIIEEMTTSRIVEHLAQDLIDCGILATPLKDSRIIERVLYYESFNIYFSPSHILLKSRNISTRDLDEDEMWILDEGHCLRNQIEKICNFKKKNYRLSYVGGSINILAKLVDSGVGFTIIPELCNDSVDKGRLRPLLKMGTNEKVYREISLVTMRSFTKVKHIEALEEIIVSTLPEEIKSFKKKVTTTIPP